MDIKILGTGCAKCKSLEKVVREVVVNEKINASIEKVEDITEIMKFGVMVTPALVIDGIVIIKGRIPSSKEISEILGNKIFRI